MRRRTVILGSLAALVVSAGAMVALPRVTDGLPKSLATAARLPERLWTRVWSPRVPKRDRLAGLTAPERDTVRALTGRINARMVWSSNRSGNHELYLLDLVEGSVRRLTNNPAVDFFSRFSPDGRQIVFVRSQREWVSARDPTAWDVYLIGVDGSGERRIAVGGYHPTWTADGTAVVFLRGTRLFRYDVATGRETLALDVANELPGVEEFGDAELAPDGRRWAFPLRGHFKGGLGLTGSFSGAAVLDSTTRKLILLTTEQACETTWAPDGQRLLWVETGGHGGTRVMTGRSDGTDRQVFMDLPGAYSHEYFPKLSNDGRWLVWGAAAEGHEQDRADYEIFVWEVGTPVERAVRLTHHPGNDQWPDLWVAPRR
jgi:Tol biopolymer transport system component